jgi:hypothetical protein
MRELALGAALVLAVGCVPDVTPVVYCDALLVTGCAADLTLTDCIEQQRRSRAFLEAEAPSCTDAYDAYLSCDLDALAQGCGTFRCREEENAFQACVAER